MVTIDDHLNKVYTEINPFRNSYLKITSHFLSPFHFMCLTDKRQEHYIQQINRTMDWVEKNVNEQMTYHRIQNGEDVGAKLNECLQRVKQHRAMLFQIKRGNYRYNKWLFGLYKLFYRFVSKLVS